MKSLITLLCIAAAPALAATRYVNLNNPAPAAPYSGWASAATTIQDAIDAATAGDEIVVTNGVYATGGRLFYGWAGGRTTNRVSIAKPVHVRSVNGPHATVIEGVRSNGLNSVSCAYLTNGASLTGFTLTNGGALGWLDEGGGAWCESADSIVADCILVGNVCANDGGGAFGGTLRRCVLSDNNAQDQGGGAYGSILENCVIKNNVSGRNGGGTSESRLFNCLVTGNRSGTGGGTHSGSAINSIVYGNIRSEFVGTELSYSCTSQQTSAGLGNISVAPLFVNAAAGDYHLRSDSPCIDAGTNLSAIITDDVDGNPRPLDGNGDGLAAFDMGPYEGRPLLLVWQGSPNPTPPFRTWATAAHTIQDAIDDASTGDEIVVTNGVYATGGRPFYAEAHDLTNRVLVTKPVVLRSVNGPEATIIHGHKVPTADGGGVEGLGGSGAVRCVYLSSGATLRGFTLTNGATFPGALGGADPVALRGGGAYCETGAVISNCVVVGNSAALGGGVGGEAGSLISHCAIVRNDAARGGGVAGCRVEFSLVQENSGVDRGGGAHSSTLIDCTLATNTLTRYGSGAGAYGSTLERCLVIRNRGDYFNEPESRAVDGGGVAYSRLLNCLVISNFVTSLGFGGGCFFSSLTNCTVVGNYGGYAGGIFAGTAVNCIVYGNHGGFANYYVGAGVFQNTCTFPMPTNGNGNITNEPAFVDMVAGNYRLRLGSPCIDTGTDVSAVVSLDLDGLPRPVDGNRDGEDAFDMGAYEFTALFFTSITRIGSNVKVSWFDSPVGADLQATSSLEDPMWTAVPIAAGTNCVELPLDSSNTFFRLMRP